MSVIWQTAGETTNVRGLSSVAFEVKIVVSAFLFIGGIHLCLILIAFSQYGNIDQNWTERLKRIVSTVQEEADDHSIDSDRSSQSSNTRSSSPIPAVDIDPGTPASPSQKRDLPDYNTGAHQPSQHPSAKPHSAANAAASTFDSPLIPPQPPYDLYPGNRLVPQFSASSP